MGLIALAMAMKAMKAAKAMKATRMSKIATGRKAKAMVWRGSKQQTSGGFMTVNLKKNKRGKIVSIEASASALYGYKNRRSNFPKWIAAVKRARKELKLEGFVAIKKGTAFYEAIRWHYLRGLNFRGF